MAGKLSPADIERFRTEGYLAPFSETNLDLVLL
jgi:hypothetical protein